MAATKPASKGKGKAKGKDKLLLGPATVAKPALFGAGALFVVQFAMRVFLKA